MIYKTVTTKHNFWTKKSWNQQTFLVFQDILTTSSVQQFFIFQDVFKTSSRCVSGTPSKEVFKTSPGRFQNFFSRPLQDAFKTSSRCLHDVFAGRLGKQKNVHWRHLQEVFKTSSTRLYQDECLLGSVLWLEFFHEVCPQLPVQKI